MDEIKKIPPVTRFLCISTVAVSVPLMLQLVSPYPFFFDWKRVSENFEIWRAFTSFFFAGSGINFIFDFAMLYRNSNALEEGAYSGRSADYAWHLLLSAISIIALNIPLKSPVHFRPLFITITTVASLLNPEAQTSLFGMLTFPQKFFPLALLGMDLMMGGANSAATAVTGIITGYGLWLLEWKDDGPRAPLSRRPGTGRTIGRAPGWISAFVGEQAVAPPAGVHVQTPQAPAAAAAPTTSNGRNWGPGRRLGSE